MRPDYTIIPWDRSSADQTGFITASWLSSFQREHWTRRALSFLSGEDPLTRRLSAELYDGYRWTHSQVMNTLLDKPSCEVSIAVLTEDPTLFCGFLVGERLDNVTVLHYCFIKPLYRGQGIASDLVTRFRNEAPLVISHRTREANQWIKNHNPRYVPWPAWVRRIEPKRKSA